MCSFQTFIVKNTVRNDEFDCYKCKCGAFVCEKWLSNWMIIMGRGDNRSVPEVYNCFKTIELNYKIIYI